MRPAVFSGVTGVSEFLKTILTRVWQLCIDSLITLYRVFSEKTCGPPSAIANGYFSGIDFTIGGRVFYYCNEGYHLVGENYMYCNADQNWSGDTPTCIGR